jgi:hypothetical protein
MATASASAAESAEQIFIAGERGFYNEHLKRKNFYEE